MLTRPLLCQLVDVLLLWNLLAKGSGYPWPCSLISKPLPGKMLGQPASLWLLPLVHLLLESSDPASLLSQLLLW